MGDSGGGRGGGGKDASSTAALANQAQVHYSVGKYEKALECLQRLATQMVRFTAWCLSVRKIIDNSVGRDELRFDHLRSIDRSTDCRINH